MPPSTPAHPNQGFLWRAQRIFLYLGFIYAGAVLLLAVPAVQTHILFLHKVKWPLWAEYDKPEHYGLAPGKTFNLQLNTSDNVTLGAWFVLSETYYQTHTPSLTTSDEEERITQIRAALAAHPTVLFLHGNAATRAAPLRIATCAALSARLGVNVLAPDYRGYADSAGTPSEPGLLLDALASYHFLLDHGANPGDVLVMGHSLGAAVAAQLGAEVAKREGEGVRGVVLLSPFATLRGLLDTYRLFGFWPLMRPLQMIPGAPGLVTKALNHKFETASIVKDIKAPVLIAHAQNDWEIPIAHADLLFQELLDPQLPALPTGLPEHASAWSRQDWTDYTNALTARGDAIAKLVSRANVPGLGESETFSRSEEGKGQVVLLRTLYGGHDWIGSLEGVQDAVGRAFGLQR